VTVREHDDAPGDGPVKDPGLEGKLAAERAGILAWAVRGCLGWQDVEPGDLPNAVDGRAVAERAVGASLEAYSSA